MRVPANHPSWPPPAELVGRRAECRVLDQLADAVRGGASRALVVHGEPGIGKTALLEYLAGHSSGCQLARAAGVQTEMELAFAGLQQLCGPMLDQLPALSKPQADALRTTFGLHDGPPPDRFLIGLGVLNLLSETAQVQPLLCLVDDYQWLDYASAAILAFVTRRLGSESVGLVFATRSPSENLAGLPDLAVPGLRPMEARELLDSAVPGPLDSRIRDQIVAESRGNPLALLELPRGLTPTDLEVGFELPGAVPVSGSIEENFGRRINDLPESTRRLLLLASVEPTGDPILFWRAATRMGIDKVAAVPAVEVGLIDIDTRIRFRHPIVRSVAYQSASVAERQQAHAALAAVTDPEADAERRSWHRAQAALGPDETVATELDRSAERGESRVHRYRGDLPTAGCRLVRGPASEGDPGRAGSRGQGARRGLRRGRPASGHCRDRPAR